MNQKTDRQTIYLKPNIEARSRNHCYRGRAISIAYSVCVFVDLVSQHAMRMRHVVMFGLPRPTIFFQTAQFSEKITEHKMCVWIFSKNFVRNISCSKKN
jgi:hypothetical protein